MKFSTEQVTKYHPDKYADQISDAILTECLKRDKESHVACETMVKNETVVLGGEITTSADIDYEKVVRKVAADLNYKVSSIVNLITEQSPEINNAVCSKRNLGAGDQGMMYGYACKGPTYLPYGFYLANSIKSILENDVQSNDRILKGDAKVQVTTDLSGDSWKKAIDTILISVCHNPSHTVSDIRKYVSDLVIRKLGLKEDTNLLINPSGAWTYGGPYADCGLTGRKIVCDQYGGYCPVGGGAFSGKDPSKVDRSGTYMARKIAVDLIDSTPELSEVTVQLAYAIGVSEPVSVNIIPKFNCVNPGVTAEDLVKAVETMYDLTPGGIIDNLHLLDLDYYSLSNKCHMLNFV